LRDSAGGLVDFFTGLILYLVLMVYLFLHQATLIAWLKGISPLADTINERYLSHMAAVGRSMVFGTFIVGAVQGILGAIFLTIAGIPYPIFWAVILTILSFIPLGGGILTIPIGIIQLLLGNIWQGVFILSTHFIVVTNIDNVLRALLVSKKAQLPSILTLFAAFAGIKFFGAIGVIFGPIIMVVIMTTIQIYNEFGGDGVPLKSAR
jgi:predicted PurR-regulated permease PerM